MMRYKLLGRTGLRVSELCLGTMTFGESWGFGCSKEESTRLFELFTELGGNFIDTANRYTEGESETILGGLIAPNRDRYVVASKYTLSTDLQDPNANGNHRKNLVRSVEASLRRLETDYLDVLLVHLWDGTTPVDEVMRALDDLVRQGKILHLGISDTPAWVISQANTLADLRGLTRFNTVQLEYNLVDRTAEHDLLPMARSHGMAVMVWGALASGLLSGKWSNGKDHRLVDSRRQLFVAKHNTDRNHAILHTLHKVAEMVESTPARVALAWLRQQRPEIIPVLGARRAGQMTDLLGCLQLTLDVEHLTLLDDVTRPAEPFPHHFLNSAMTKATVYGDLIERMEFLDP